jgi:hypothetical protein
VVSDLVDQIKSRAAGDNGFAIAYGLLCVANAIDRLGTNDAATQMGAIEFLGAQVGEVAASIDRITDAMPHEDAFRTDHPLMGETLGGITDALQGIASAIAEMRE